MRTVWILILVLAAAPALLADVVVLKNGLKLYGTVSQADCRVSVTLDGKTHTVNKNRVARVVAGESRFEEFSRRSKELGDDAAGWYRLALWARSQKLPRVREALETVLKLDPDHRATRRMLGYERIGGAWVTGAEAQRRKGFVLCGGKWMLPAEADRLMKEGLMKQAPATDAHRKRATQLAKALLDDDAAVRKAAQQQLREVPDAALVRPMKRVLYAAQPKTRILAVKTLGRIGDRTALPWLIQVSMYDASSEVRNAAFRSVRGFRDADVFFPYARALFSKSPRATVMAANALGALGDMRGVDIVLRRVSIGIGEAGRANIMVGKQNSYIQDFDVEIAQAAAIGDPIVQTIRDGIILDYKILGGYGEAWILEKANAFADALSQMTGRDYGKNWKRWREYAKENDLPRVKLR